MFEAHRLCVSLNSRLASNKEEENYQPSRQETVQRLQMSPLLLKLTEVPLLL